MTHPNARHKEIERDARRAKVAKLLLGGVTNQTDIAEQLGVDQSTISRDIKVIEAEWQTRAAEDIAKAKGKDLARVERLIQALWPEAIKGKWLATDRVLALMQHRAKLLGLEAPVKREDKLTIEYRTLVQEMAADAGLDTDDVMRELEAILGGAA